MPLSLSALFLFIYVSLSLYLSSPISLCLSLSLSFHLTFVRRVHDYMYSSIDQTSFLGSSLSLSTSSSVHLSFRLLVSLSVCLSLDFCPSRLVSPRMSSDHLFFCLILPLPVIARHQLLALCRFTSPPILLLLGEVVISVFIIFASSFALLKCCSFSADEAYCIFPAVVVGDDRIIECIAASAWRHSASGI